MRLTRKQQTELLRTGPKNSCLILIHGNDAGLISDTASRFQNQLFDRESEISEKIQVDCRRDMHNNGDIESLLLSPSLFASRRIIRLQDVDQLDKKSISFLIGFDRATRETSIIASAHNLKPQSMCRRAFETGETSLVLPCYSNAGEMEALIRSTLDEAGKKIDPSARNALLSVLGGDMNSNRQEIEKVLLYALDDQIIRPDHIFPVVTGAVEDHQIECLDLCFSGSVVAISRFFQNPNLDFEHVVRISVLALREALLLNRLIENTDRNTSMDRAIQTHKPPIFFRRIPQIKRALERHSSFSLHKIANELTRVGVLVRQTQKTAPILVHRTLLRVARSSAKSPLG